MLIQIKNLEKKFKTHSREPGMLNALKSIFKRKQVIVQALKGITLDIAEGELLGLLGPNGAGKSTTMKILSGVLYPTAGDVRVMGFIPWKQRRRYVAHIGAVFGQKSQLIWDIPPLDAFEMNKAIYGISAQEYKTNLDAMTGLLAVGDIMKKPTRQLSLGERMKCEFIMAMLHNPRVVFLDEPTIGLDLLAKDTIRQFILDKNRQGVTFILTTHDIDDVEHLAKRVVVINHGETVFDNSLNALRKYLGRKKRVKLSTRSEFRDLTMEGVRVLNRLSAYDTEMELDLVQIELNHFIKIIGEQNVVTDLSIQELPVEEIIKELYREQE